ncbi:glycosyltransferase family 2 protein [Actinomadura sp. 3N508]|uniref:glycosyltransferase family 2 protein n=1 Tax=Actinomadura sp. 3N508 TaxID=3375153 RepID=UPI0037A9BED5
MTRERDGHPSVGVVIPTHNRPELLRAALDAVLAQDYPGELRVVIVYDRAEPDPSLADVPGADGRVTVVTNDRTPGLAGARNTGILALDTELVAFCDDDDKWLPEKLSAQTAALAERPDAVLASCGILVEFRGGGNARLAGAAEVTHADLVRSRMVMVHSSTYLARRAALTEPDGIGLVDETIPAGQNEDWDFALRAARRHPIVNVDEPLVRVLWGRSSLFAGEYATKIDGLRWMLEHHPELAADPVGSARVYAQIAFWKAGLGHRREALTWSRRALRANWRERRVPFALAVASGIVSDERVLRTLHSRGHGI